MDAKGDNAVTILKPIVSLPDAGPLVYIALKGSLHANDSSAFGLGDEEIKALAKKFPGSGVEVVNGISIKTNVIAALNALSQLGYKVASTTGENEITWTLKREI